MDDASIPLLQRVELLAALKPSYSPARKMVLCEDALGPVLSQGRFGTLHIVTDTKTGRLQLARLFYGGRLGSSESIVQLEVERSILLHVSVRSGPSRHLLSYAGRGWSNLSGPFIFVQPVCVESLEAKIQRAAAAVTEHGDEDEQDDEGS